MNIQLHKNARTTPAIRLELQKSTLPTKVLAREYNLHPATVKKWRNRETTEDASHRPHCIQSTLTPAQEAVVVVLRETLLLPLDDLLVVTHEFINPDVSRSGLDRCLRRHGVSNLKALMPKEEGADKPKYKIFKDYDPGFVHVDVKYLPQMPDEQQRKYLFAAIDRATRWVYVEILNDKSAKSAEGFFKRLIEKAPFKISKVLTDNGKEFTDRFCATGMRKPTGKHLVDQVCATHRIEHRLTKARTPQTNGMVERFNGRISEVLATTRFDSSKSLAETLKQYVRVYNQHIPQKALGHIAPIQALKDWREKRPDLFKKHVYNLAGLDTRTGAAWFPTPSVVC
jgi:transposase-like protein